MKNIIFYFFFRDYVFHFFHRIKQNVDFLTTLCLHLTNILSKSYKNVKLSNMLQIN
jgi:hypothetical protein